MLDAKDICFEIERDGELLLLLNKISFRLPGGHFMAIVGPSGCGKTTLLKAIAGIQPETEGQFTWKDRVFDENNDFLPGEVGYVPQFSIAYDQLTVDESIETAAKLKIKFPSSDDMDDVIDKVLEETGLIDIADRQVKILSGGQKRRLALAMELVSAPQLLLCDEVTSGLDPRSEKEIVELLHNLSRTDNRIVISVTHSLDHLELYDSILVLHEGHIAYHGSPKTLAHYFGVSQLEEIYPKLAQQKADTWSSSWKKHRNTYYHKLEEARREKHPELSAPKPADEEDEDAPPRRRKRDKKNTEPGRPGIISQFFTLLARRIKILSRDRTQLLLQLAMILLFPILVALFSSKGQEPIAKLSNTQDTNFIMEMQQQKAVNENLVRVGSAVSGIIMFEVILLGLMGSNNSAREIAGERLIMEKEKYGGVSTAAYLGSKIAFLGALIAIQSVWMYLFVEYFWAFRGTASTHLVFLILANAAMTSICLGISALSKTADQASLLSIYLVGFQLPLSGAVLALPSHIEMFVRPFISAYWSWSGSLSALNPYVHNAVKVVIDTSLTPANICYSVLGIHIIIGIALAYMGISRKQWD